MAGLLGKNGKILSIKCDQIVGIETTKKQNQSQ